MKRARQLKKLKRRIPQVGPQIVKDFFISYTGADKAWAEWIAFVLEEAGHTTIIQAWDFRPGSNFVLKMQEGAKSANRTITVLSPDYLNSGFVAPEWAAAFAQDPQGHKQKLVPVRVRSCDLEGLLPAIVYIDLVDIDEAEAREKLLDGVRQGRVKPAARPTFPGKTAKVQQKPFPARATPTHTPSKPPKEEIYMPKTVGQPTDRDKRLFLRDSYQTIRDYFKHALNTLAQRDHIEVDLHENTASEFTAEIFVNGKSASRTRIRIGGFMGDDGIAVSEGEHHGNNSYNELLSIVVAEGQLHLSGMMGHWNGVDGVKNLTSERAAAYLWKRLVEPLERRR